MMLSHLRWHSRIDAFVDGELAHHDSAAVAQHLAECWMCSSRAETSRLIKASLTGRLVEPPSLARVRLRAYAMRLSAPPPGAVG